MSHTKGQVSPRWAFMKPFDIYARDGSGDVYLHRLRIVQTPLFAVYLHDINLPDADRDPHDHPWPFAAWILRGGYTEEVWDSPAELATGGTVYSRTLLQRRWSWHRMNTTAAHMITSIQPHTKTLIITGPRKKSWGFWTHGGFVPWQEYV